MEKNNLPKGWICVTLPDIVKNKKNAIKRGPFGSHLKKEFFVKSGYKVYEQQHAINNDFNLGNYYVDEKKFQELKAFEVNSGDLIISCSGTIGKIAIVPQNFKKGIINQALLKISINPNVILIPFFSYLFEFWIKKDEVSSHGTGIGNLTSVQDLKKNYILLPPLNEQKRIVEKIEELFSELNNILKTIENIQIQLKQYKQSLLKFTFNDVSQEKDTDNTGHKIGDYVKIQNGYAFKSNWFKNNGIRLLRNINVGHGVINWTNSVFLDKRQAKQFSRFQLFENDIVISMDRPIIKSGLKLARLEKNDLPALLLQRVGKFQIFSNELENNYFYLWLQSTTFLNSLKPGRSLGVPHISATELENIEFKIPLPSINEQKKIVSNIEKKFSLIDKTENIVYVMLSQLNTLRLTVLKQAFEGKLIPQDPNDEHASELLKQ